MSHNVILTSKETKQIIDAIDCTNLSIISSIHRFDTDALFELSGMHLAMLTIIRNEIYKREGKENNI